MAFCKLWSGMEWDGLSIPSFTRCQIIVTWYDFYFIIVDTTVMRIETGTNVKWHIGIKIPDFERPVCALIMHTRFQTIHREA